MSNRNKAKGSAFEKAVAGYLDSELPFDIERRTLGGTQDRGDIAGVKINGKRAVIECKAHATMSIPEWLREAEKERVNDDAAYGIVVAKRRGVGSMNTGQQLVCMTLETLAAIIKEGTQQ